MNKEWKDKWTEALRSDKYKQTQHCLHDENGFCCLGVLCDISGVGGWKEGKIEGSFWYVVGDRESTSYLPDKVADKCDLKETGSLVDMNDSGTPFTEIADWIDRNM